MPKKLLNSSIYCAIHRIVIYLVDSIIQRLNNWGSSFTDGDLEDGVFIAVGKERERVCCHSLKLVDVFSIHTTHYFWKVMYGLRRECSPPLLSLAYLGG